MHLPATQIRRVRAWVRPRDALAAQRDLERLLIACESPTNLVPPGAILCIREVRDPLPHTLGLGRGALRPPARWREALDRQWTEFLSAAARPAFGPVAAAPSVLFANEAELLACLAVAAVNGRLADDWWWRGLLRSDEWSNWLLRWLRRSQAVPGAVVQLASRGELSTVAGRVSAEAAGTLLETLIQTFGLTHLLPVPSVLRSPDRSARTPPVPVHGPRETPGSDTLRPPVLESLPRWTASLPDLRASVGSVENRAWLAVAMLLEQAPRAVREPSFSEAFIGWLTSPVLRDEKESLAPPERSVGRAPAPKPSVTRQESADFQMPGVALGSQATASITPPRPLVPDAINSAFPPVPMQQGAVAFDLSDGPLVEAAPLSRPAAFSTPGEDPAAATELPSEPVVRFTTGFGGCFYLLNVALALGLYGDFTQPLKPGLALSPWDLLALLAGRAVGDEFTRDPLAERFASWAGRHPEDVPGAGFVPPPPEPSPLSPSPFSHHLSSWLDQVAEKFESRLRLALPSWESLPVLPGLLRQRADIETYDRVIRVRFALEDHPLAVRLAGLDRDPGWIPAAGWAVAFLYET